MGLIYVPDDMPEQDKQAAQKVVDNIYWLLMRANSFTVIDFVPQGQSCVEASYARSRFVAEYIPSNWFIDSYTWRSGLHTSNVMYFRAQDGYYYCWSVDGYAPPVTQDNVTYLSKNKTIPTAANEYLNGTTFYKHMSGNGVLQQGKGFKHQNPLAQ